jgi:hypothetical protein
MHRILTGTWGPRRPEGRWRRGLRGGGLPAPKHPQASKPNPPFLLVVDVGHSLEVFADFIQAKPADVGEILETLCAVGKARRGKADGTFLP